ncbi:MAG: hypothetical protein JNM19_09370 [Chitinophagaceae bacterium]|nr:hypothetical protein [Chitinophagaceae bacterium]
MRNIEYDTLLNTEVYVFDSVKNGNVSFTLVSYLDRTYQKTISLESDTTILIRKDELNDFPATKDNIVPSMKLNTGDSLVIALYHAGCYSFFKENISIRKEKDTYHVRFNTPRLNMYGEASIHHKTEFDSSFGTRIDSFYFACNELLKLEKRLFCTSTSVIYIRLGDNVFRMPGFGCTNWPGYYNLINSIDIPWPKESNASR